MKISSFLLSDLKRQGCPNGALFALLFVRSLEVGGAVNPFSSNVFIRETDIKNNKILKEKEIYQAKKRPLSYYLAHEITHVMQHKISNIMPLTIPKYIIEGYADYIGKEPDFDYDKFLQEYKENDFFMTIESGMYNRYHLLVAYLMDKKGMSFREIVEKKPSREEVERLINELGLFGKLNEKKG